MPSRIMYSILIIDEKGDILFFVPFAHLRENIIFKDLTLFLNLRAVFNPFCMFSEYRDITMAPRDYPQPNQHR